MRNFRTPIYDALVKHHQLDPLSFHVPGHKYGSLYDELHFPYFSKALQLDATELSHLDDLYAPQGIIKEAQQLAAELYGVASTYFLVNGSTVGNLAMILASCQEGDVVFVQRNCHKSVMHGLELAGAEPVFLAPNIDQDYQVPSYVSIETVKKAYQKYPQVKAIILTSPTYYGLTYKKLGELVAFAHSHKIPVLVDEAHGAHFISSSLFPPSAISAGADVVVQSAHKTLPAMTMGSFLHFNSSLVNEEKVTRYLHMLQTSSPSYLVMASLDIARAYLQSIMEREDEIYQCVQDFVKIFQRLENIDIVTSKDPFLDTDPLKLTIRSKNGLSGYELIRYFEKAAIYPELADPLNVLFVLPLGCCSFETSRFEMVNDQLKLAQFVKTDDILQEVHVDLFSKLSIPFKKMADHSSMFVPLANAEGEVASELIIPYPPGIPLIMKGERITKYHIESLKTLLKLHAKFQGGEKLHEGLISIFIKR